MVKWLSCLLHFHLSITTQFFYFAFHFIPPFLSSLILAFVLLFTLGMRIRWVSIHIFIFLHSWNLFGTFQIKVYGALCFQLKPRCPIGALALKLRLLPMFQLIHFFWSPKHRLLAKTWGCQEREGVTKIQVCNMVATKKLIYA